MEASVCVSCQRPGANLVCGGCKRAVCKKCVEGIEENAFSFLEPVPEELSHRYYCGLCFQEKIVPAQSAYRRTMAQAKRVFVFFKSQGEETRLMRRAEKPLRIEACNDRDETLMRLAFFAAQAGFNALIDVELTAKKVRNAAYQTSVWRGSGVPTQVDGEKLERMYRSR